VLEEDHEQQIPLFIACDNSNVEIARLLLQYEPEQQVISENRDGRTPLMMAIHNGNVDMVNLLLEFTPEQQIEVIDEQFKKYTPLMLACERFTCPTEIVLSLLAHDPEHQVMSYSQCENGFTPLMVAVNARAVDKVKALLQYIPESQVTNCTDSGMRLTPLMMAIQLGSRELVELLLKYDPREQLACKDLCDQTALHRACATHRPEVVQLLLARSREEALLPNLQREIPLHIACRIGNREICRLLLHQNPVEQLSAQDGAGSTPASLALTSALRDELQQQLEHLIRSNPLMTYANGETGLHVSCRLGNLDLMKSLLATHEEEQLSRRDSEGNNVLHHVCCGPSSDALRLISRMLGPTRLVEYSEEQNDFEETPLHRACVVGTVEAVRMLLKLNSQNLLMMEDIYADIPLISLCRRSAFPQVSQNSVLQRSLVEKVRLLQSHKSTAQLLHQNATDDFALSLACHGYIPRIVELLLETEPDKQVLSGTKREQFLSSNPADMDCTTSCRYFLLTPLLASSSMSVPESECA